MNLAPAAAAKNTNTATAEPDDFGLRIGDFGLVSSQTVISVEKAAAVPTVAAFSIIRFDGGKQSKIQNLKSRMLRTLYIRDYALIEELEVAFDSGLNILTGETGAGKSIIVGALKMILGERASTEVVRTGAKKAVIEGIFDEADVPKLRALLDANQIDGAPQMILRREITPSHSRAFINDTPATLPVIRDVAAHLIDLHGQHEHQSLLRVETLAYAA